MDSKQKIGAGREIALLELIEKLEDAAVDQASYVSVPGSLAALILAREQVSGAIRQLFTEHAQTLASKEAELFDLRRIASLAGHIADNRDAKDWALMNLDISEAAELARKYFTRAALTQPTE